jgi:hypothetical protein
LGGNSIVMLLVAAATAFYVGSRNPPLFSTRPAEPASEIGRTSGEQDVDARLWQDPFDAVNRGIADRRAEKRDPYAGHGIDEFKRLPEPTLLLGVGLPYPEAVETRRRLRYAVLSALHVAEARYFPSDERHIGYLVTDKNLLHPAAKPETVSWRSVSIATPVARHLSAEHVLVDGSFRVVTNGSTNGEAVADADKPSDLPAIVPFEQYETSDGKKRVAVLWLDENALVHQRKPITSLRNLWGALQTSKNEEFVFVGPQDSNVLRMMAHELQTSDTVETKCNEEPPVSSLDIQLAKAADGALRQPTKKLRVYNFGATAVASVILERDKEKETAEAELKTLFCRGGVRYYRTTSTDKELAEQLARELKLRRIDLCPPGDASSQCRHPNHDRIFLLSERDTIYGRSLPQSVAATFGADNSSFGGCRLNISHGVMHASYLRGLDGRLPSRPTAKAEPAEPEKSAGDETGEPNRQETVATPETAHRFESAEGQSQFDYLLRLTAALSRSATRNCAPRTKERSQRSARGIVDASAYRKGVCPAGICNRADRRDGVGGEAEAEPLVAFTARWRGARRLVVGHPPMVQREPMPVVQRGDGADGLSRRRSDGSVRRHQHLTHDRLADRREPALAVPGLVHTAYRLDKRA